MLKTVLLLCTHIVSPIIISFSFYDPFRLEFSVLVSYTVVLKPTYFLHLSIIVIYYFHHFHHLYITLFIFILSSFSHHLVFYFSSPHHYNHILLIFFLPSPHHHHPAPSRSHPRIVAYSSSHQRVTSMLIKKAKTEKIGG